MTGGAGNDIYYVDALGDVITEASNAGTDIVRTTLSVYSLSSWLENIEYLGPGDFTAQATNWQTVITGGAGNDTLSGGAGNDALICGIGNDVLNGGTGSDAMTGGVGNDTYVVDSTGDTVSELSARAPTPSGPASPAIASATTSKNLVYTGSSTFTGIGNSLNNVMTAQRCQYAGWQHRP